MLQEHVGFHQSVISSKLCFGVDLHRGTETNDVGYVRTGTLCRPQVFCSNTYCNGTLTDLRYDCIPEKCNYRGICNNRRNCHCHIGWDPPYCIQVGIGGSVDSGPPKTERVVKTSPSTNHLFETALRSPLCLHSCDALWCGHKCKIYQDHHS